MTVSKDFHFGARIHRGAFKDAFGITDKEDEFICEAIEGKEIDRLDQKIKSLEETIALISSERLRESKKKEQEMREEIEAENRVYIKQLKMEKEELVKAVRKAMDERLLVHGQVEAAAMEDLEVVLAKYEKRGPNE